MTKMEGEYKCNWPHDRKICGHEFTAQFGRILTVKGSSTERGVHGGCSVVKCPKCGHKLKPISDAIKLREIKTKE